MRSAIWENIFRRGKGDESETALALRHVPVFADLSPREIREVEHIVHQRDYASGETVFRKGDPGLGMYIIIHGGVQIADDEDPEHLVVYSEMGDGDFFGDMALLDESDRSASALATAETRLIAFFRPELRDIMSRLPSLGNKILFNLAKVTVQRLRRTNDLLIETQKAQTISEEPAEANNT